MHSFKVGDKVRRTVFSEYGYNPNIHGKPGVVYTLTSVDGFSLSGKGDDGSKLNGASPEAGKFELVVPKPSTNDQIIAEAERRWCNRTKGGMTVVDYVIEVVREGWVPTPVPAVLLAARESMANRYPHHGTGYNRGLYDTNVHIRSFMDGAAWRKANPSA